MNDSIKTNEILIGVVGLGLMGSSVVTALLIAGHRVKGIAPLPGDMDTAHERIREQLEHCAKADLLSGPIEWYMKHLVVSQDYTHLSSCSVVLECVIEEMSVKESVYKKITDEVTVDTIIASNTSAIPISHLQMAIPHPERFLGVHWAEPAYMTRFLEITCGHKTSAKYATWVFDLARHWGKEPTLLRKDIRGFVTNRLMYAIYREMFSLIQKGDATVEDVDKAFRYDAGSWMTLMGVFRRMDFLGIKDFHRIFENIFPTLCNDDAVPEIMKELVRKKLRGTQDAEGIYPYTIEEAKEWDAAFALFNEDIFSLAARYPYELIDKRAVLKNDR
jgi:3-hydroxybutyryl-CoA dehydrogenase